MEKPGVGIGVYVLKDRKVLLGKRKGGWGAGAWGAPGGKMDMWESPEECAYRETIEETGLEIDNLRFVANINDVDRENGVHYLTPSYFADWKSGEPRVMEPDKFETWEWFALNSLPQPLFLPARNFFESGINLLEI